MRDVDVFSHTTAALLWGVPLPVALEQAGLIHVAAHTRPGRVIPQTRPRVRGVVGHELSDRRIRRCIRHGLPVTDAATTWLQLAPLVSLHDLVAAGDHLVLTPRHENSELDRPFTTVADLAARVVGFRGRGRRTADAALGLIRDGAESRRETHLRLALVEAGLPEPELQHPIAHADGRFIAYGDMAYPRYGVLVEYDGQQHREDSRQYHRDVERHDEIIAEGWLHIRVDKHAPRSGPGSAAARTRSALTARGWRS
ncbi:MAG: hypothetical protein EPO52_01450 [Herbiconiux sp.]|uniref:hypothetical protein n=1 Tax=Herbiconiux sp. TaxID=1871186 RepID=UPI00120331AA|nr:hypothetical protein [Herbiconiux sp.]TAJ50020.1 MAG: hypothetical protein EPO52_01450 [Herbiconiux sp.]